MKRLCLLFASLIFLPASLSAQIYADFVTSKGNFTCLIDHVNTPLAAANFIGLAEGSRAWIDEPSGGVKTNKPFYNGLTFHRVIDEGAFRIAQAGSPNGQGTDGPGYTFPDEAQSAFGEPYLLAMANAGPNTNGSQFFLTGSLIAALDGKHTVFGQVITGTSRTIVESILTTPTDDKDKPTTPVVINSITIRRLGASATNFNIHTQQIPTISRPKPGIQFIPGTSTKLNFTPPTGSLIRGHYSTNLTNWQQIIQYYVDSDDTPITSFDIGSYTGNPATCFFNLSTVDYPANALTPSNLNGRVFTGTYKIDQTSPSYIFAYTFTSESGGTVVVSLSGQTVIQGTFILIGRSLHGYGATLSFQTSFAYPYQFLRSVVGYHAGISFPALLRGETLSYYGQIIDQDTEEIGWSPANLGVESYSTLTR